MRLTDPWIQKKLKKESPLFDTCPTRWRTFGRKRADFPVCLAHTHVLLEHVLCLEEESEVELPGNRDDDEGEGPVQSNACGSFKHYCAGKKCKEQEMVQYLCSISYTIVDDLNRISDKDEQKKVNAALHTHPEGAWHAHGQNIHDAYGIRMWSVQHTAHMAFALSLLP